MRSRLALGLLFALLVASNAQAQARDTVIIVSLSPSGNLRYGVPTEFVLVADVTLAASDTGSLAMGFNVDDPRRYRMIASTAVYRGTQRVTLRATVPPVDWSGQGLRFAYIVNIRPLELPSAQGVSRALATVRGEFGAMRAGSVLPRGDTSATRGALGVTRNDTGFVQPSTGERLFFEFQVEKPVRHAPGSAAPRYPPELKAAGVDGEVLVQFVVDTLGVADLRSFRVLKASHGDFIESVKAALPDMKFVPAELRGRKVRQLVQQPFVFAIQKNDSTGVVVDAPPPRAPRPQLPEASVTPAPRAGTVPGWTVAFRLTVDSGFGAPAASSTHRVFGAAGHARFEIAAPTPSPLGTFVSLTDSASGRMTLLMPAMKSATVMPTPRRADLPMTSRFRPSEDGIKDLGAGESIAGLSTHRYRVTGVTESRFDLGDRVCVASQESTTELWTTADPKFASIQRRVRALSAAMPGAATVPLAETELGALATLGPVVKTVMLNALPMRERRGDVTVTYELLRFSEGPLDASLFESPEGYQLRDLTSFIPPERSDSMRTAALRQMFDRMVDTTRVIAGVTTTCTPAKAP